MDLSTLEIISINPIQHSVLTTQLRELFEAQWADFADFDQEDQGVKTPLAMAAMVENQLIGGLAFSLWQDPEASDTVIWINGVVIDERFRRLGIASQLISAAMKVQTPLFVLADIKAIYEKLGWTLVKTDNDGSVLKWTQQSAFE
ncbi:GNAT family N-acetyltransferase [Alginatibacterium sediminis]|uniref:GNAT family N-acetyltransferase n=1 Tax=Alginatibacterium sediminis TaxID=2164068 RepID=A0A420EHA0_9ALTE|nr:GNAT family N-acetyltransferase [Alginatibacterium sediminis]RKF20085.1 GNAT family N-acetyltransferase [Alginatibacterium sediminis]